MSYLAESGLHLDKILSSKRQIEIDQKELKEFLNNCIPVTDTNNVSENPLLGEDDEFIWKDTNPIPSFIKTIIRQCKDMFNLNNDIKSTKVTIYKSATRISKKEYTIKRTDMNVASRIIICSGNKEVFNILMSAKGQKAESKYTCVKNDAFQISMGLASGIDISFNDMSGITGPPRKGWRNNIIKKDPTQRYVIVVDGIVDEQVLVNKITKNMNMKQENIDDEDVNALIGENTNPISKIVKPAFDESEVIIEDEVIKPKMNINFE
jgi:hypothetical protein